MSKSLTQAVLEFKKTGKDWAELLERICLYVYEFPRKNTTWDADRCSEFFTAFMPRIPGLVERYIPAYKFETYLTSSLRWFIKTFAEHVALQTHRIQWAQDIILTEGMLVSEPDVSFEIKSMIKPPSAVNDKGVLLNKAMRSRLLYVTLIYAEDIDYAWLPSLAVMTGVELTWLERKLAEAKDIIRRKAVLHRIYCKRRNEYWYRTILARKRMFNEGRWNPDIFWKYQIEYNQWYVRYQKMQKKLKTYKVRLSYSELGKLLGVPKGTIACGVHHLRRYLVNS